VRRSPSLGWLAEIGTSTE